MGTKQENDRRVWQETVSDRLHALAQCSANGHTWNKTSTILASVEPSRSGGWISMVGRQKCVHCGAERTRRFASWRQLRRFILGK